jgi:hypothetical protein
MSFHINAQTFDLCALQFGYRARGTGAITPNLLRGAFGSALKRISEDDYQRYFAPKGAGGPSGLADPPRPFVFRQPAPGVIGVNLFAKDAVEVFSCAMQNVDALEIERLERRDLTLSLQPPR